MKAMVMGSLGLANLALRDVPDPKPGPGQVLVRMRAASLNFRDLLTLDGKYGSMQKRENLILLSDGAGEIAEVGAGVKEWKTGDRVVGCFFPYLAGRRAAGVSAARRAGRARRRRRLRSIACSTRDAILADPAEPELRRGRDACPAPRSRPGARCGSRSRPDPSMPC